MASLSGPLFAAAVLLVIAGVLKVARPDATRVALRSAGLPGRAWMVRTLGGAEVAIAAAALAVGGAVPAALVAGTYLGFAGFAFLLARRTNGTASCGCFGTGSAAVGPIHVAANLIVAVVALAAVGWPADGVGAAFDNTPALGIPFVLLTLVLTALVHAALTALPDLVEARSVAR